MSSSYMAVEVLERRLAARDKELKERLERIGQLERELSQRDGLIRQLRADLDKCQQVLKPLQQVEGVDMAQIAPWRVASKNGSGVGLGLEPRFKRLAISAEPLLLPRSLLLANSAAELQQSLPVNRQPKSAQWVTLLFSLSVLLLPLLFLAIIKRARHTRLTRPPAPLWIALQQ